MSKRNGDDELIDTRGYLSHENEVLPFTEMVCRTALDRAIDKDLRRAGEASWPGIMCISG